MQEGEVIWKSDDGRVVAQFLGTVDRWSRERRAFVPFDRFAVAVDGRVLNPSWLSRTAAVIFARNVADERSCAAA